MSAEAQRASAATCSRASRRDVRSTTPTSRARRTPRCPRRTGRATAVHAVAATKRKRWSGEVVRIRTKMGRSVTCTPDHPLATSTAMATGRRSCWPMTSARITGFRSPRALMSVPTSLTEATPTKCCQGPSQQGYALRISSRASPATSSRRLPASAPGRRPPEFSMITPDPARVRLSDSCAPAACARTRPMRWSSRLTGRRSDGAKRHARPHHLRPPRPGVLEDRRPVSGRGLLLPGR